MSIRRAALALAAFALGLVPVAMASSIAPAADAVTGAATEATAPAAVAPHPSSAPEPSPMSVNRLGSEKSPYLLQHKNNPVWWQPWGPEAFAEAKRRDVPVFLSVGYSTCHWCHVMEHESFESEAVARALNENFVAIKVDREERPDVDALYMDAVHAMGQRGGWPMSVWMTPDGKPFFAGTYFPREHFLELLAAIVRAWHGDRTSLEEQAKQVADVLGRAASAERAGGFDDGTLLAFLGEWGTVFDPVHGGRRGAPKFPPAYDLRLLMNVSRRMNGGPAMTIVTTTLDRMAASGTYDHLGGGFHRYSTDEQWLVPHFEKMLYDQASLVNAYLDAYQITGEREYQLVVRETLDYVLRDLTHPQGGFYSAEDADSEGEEGRFYVWTPAELETILGKERAALVAAAYGVTKAGNFEHGTSILHLQPDHARTTRSPELAAALRTLFEARAKRIRPHLDDKVLADWNGLMIAAMARAGAVLDEPRYVAGATRAARFVLTTMRGDDGSLRHRWRDGEAAIPGFLDDYAFFVHGLVDLYQATFDPAWLTTARELVAKQDALFWDAARGDYFSTDGNDQTLLARRVEPFDNVVPAGRSVVARNALQLADLLLDKNLAEHAGQVLAGAPSLARKHPGAFAKLLAAADHALDDSKEVAVVGALDAEDTRTMLRALRAIHQPNMVLAAGSPGANADAVPLLKGRPMKEGRATAYVCESGVCALPTTDTAEAVRLASTARPLAGRKAPDTTP